MMDIKESFASMFYNFVDKETIGFVSKCAAVTTAYKSAFESKNILNQQLAEDLHQTIIRKFKNCKVYSSFKGSIQGTALADMQLQ